MKKSISPSGTRRPRPMICLLAATVLFHTSVQAQTQTVTVDANNVVRDIPLGLGGVCAATDFWNTLTPNYRDQMMRAKVKLVRINSYPTDSLTDVGTVEALDRKVAQILNAGAVPLFIQCIEAESTTIFKNALLRLDGTLYPAGDSTSIRQRVATNLTYLANRYRSAPFNLTTQYWEIGNEPDLAGVNYKVADAAEYIDFFTRANNQLVASGIRNNVLLAGPVLSWDYGYDTWRDNLMNEFLTYCGGMVDIVTRHQYSAIRAWEGIPYTPTSLLNSAKQIHHYDASVIGSQSRGEYNLLQAMNTRGVDSSVGTGMTEMNLFTNENGTTWTHQITQGLFFVLANRNMMYNPRSLVGNGFQFDRNNHDLAYFQSNNPSYPYWATYIHGVLTGKQLLAQTSSSSSLVVAGSKDERSIYVQVLNRHETSAFTTNVTLNNAGSVGAPKEYRLSASETPLTELSPAIGTAFSRSFPPMSVTIFRYPRNGAPTDPVPPAPPTTSLFTTSFDTTPSGMQTYASGYTPTVSSSRLQLTSTVANMRSAVIFNGQPLTAARSRVQVRFGFQVVHPNAEGIVFGAYSVSPGAVGNAGEALGYFGQSNRIWGVKLDNNPDQLAVIAAATTDKVDGWATQAITPYSGTDMFRVIDYDGGARTVRARMYQGTSESGTLRADVTNSIGNPAALPAGTVFGFTGATGGYTQTTYIYDLAILADNGTGNFVVGQEVIVDNLPANQTGAWVSSTISPGYYGTDYSHDNNTNKGSCSTTYTPSLVGSGPRDVYVRYISGSGRTDRAPYTVNHAGGSQTVLVDQRTGGGTWQRIGTWTFNHGTSGSVVLSNLNTTGFVIADAVRFVNVAP